MYQTASPSSVSHSKASHEPWNIERRTLAASGRAEATTIFALPRLGGSLLLRVPSGNVSEQYSPFPPSDRVGPVNACTPDTVDTLCPPVLQTTPHSGEKSRRGSRFPCRQGTAQRRDCTLQRVGPDIVRLPVQCVQYVLIGQG